MTPPVSTPRVQDEHGKWGETQAARYLRRRRYRILGRGVRPGPKDEIDIVASKDDVLVFVEVKTRARTDFGRPGEAVKRDKRRVQSRAAVRYLKKLGCPPTNIRFDIIEVVGSPGGGPREITHVEDAFLLDPRYTLPF